MRHSSIATTTLLAATAIALSNLAGCANYSYAGPHQGETANQVACRESLNLPYEYPFSSPNYQRLWSDKQNAENNICLHNTRGWLSSTTKEKDAAIQRYETIQRADRNLYEIRHNLCTPQCNFNYYLTAPIDAPCVVKFNACQNHVTQKYKPLIYRKLGLPEDATQYLNIGNN